MIRIEAGRQKEQNLSQDENTVHIDTISRSPLTEPVKSKAMKNHFWFANIIALAIIASFLTLLFLKNDVPTYLIGFVGSIIGYYIAKAPYDI